MELREFSVAVTVSADSRTGSKSGDSFKHIICVNYPYSYTHTHILTQAHGPSPPTENHHSSPSYEASSWNIRN